MATIRLRRIQNPAYRSTRPSPPPFALERRPKQEQPPIDRYGSPVRWAISAAGPMSAGSGVRDSFIWNQSVADRGG